MNAPRWRVLFAKLWWGDPAEASLGRRGERAAARHLKSLGFQLLKRNVRLHAGECDLLMRAPDRATLVIVEVKTRRLVEGRPHPPPEASVHARKRAKLLLLASLIAKDRRHAGRPVRIDVVAVDWPDRGSPTFRHFEGAVRG